MPKINILSPEVVSKIAAGEVIERPASALKEIIENSLDAQATEIEVSLKDAGRTLISLKDNGCGIDAGDMKNLFIRHSTSKIRDTNDLFNIGSLGFRGEALYSIAAISDVILRSKTSDKDCGWETHVRGGEKMSMRPATMKNGTEIEIKELFFNTPARRKFLKTDTTELNQALNIFTPYTLLYPKHRFKFTHNDNVLFELSPRENRIKRIAETLRLQENNLIETRRDYPQEDISIHLILGDINIQRNRKDMQFIFINNRPVQNRALSFHLNQVYRLIMPEEVSPFFAVFIDLPKETVDVNTHPTKREVKIKDENRLGSLLRSLSEFSIMSYGKPKQVDKTTLSAGQKDQKITLDSPEKGRMTLPDPGTFSRPAEQTINHSAVTDIREFLFGEKAPEDGKEQERETPETSRHIRQAEESLREKLSSARYIGIFIKKYLIFETPSSLLIIDQHAAQERITYEKLKHQIQSGKVEVQHLLSPIIIKVTPQEMLIWKETKETLESMGLATTLMGKDSIALHAHPHIIADPEFSLRGLLAEDSAPKTDTDTLARRACRMSLMSGHDSKPVEAEHIKKQLFLCNDPFTCPHGRPTVIEVGEKFLNKQFLR